jgi:caa(3)-type oxidase subunit IV
MKHVDKKADFQFGLSIFILLAFLTVAEYFVAIEFSSTFILLLIALSKAGLVLYYYMHIRRLFVEDTQVLVYGYFFSRIRLFLADYW